jgi:hypothetical protein
MEIGTDMNALRVTQAEEPTTAISITAAQSFKGREAQHGNQSDDHGTISEHQEEYDNDSNPPGSIERDHEISSEKIQFQGHNFKKHAQKAFTVHNDEDSAGEASKEARKSNVTKVSKVAEVSPPVQLIETARSVESFNMTYDRVFAIFQAKLTAEYDKMHQTYIGEYQHNMDLNTSRKDDRIAEMNQSIDTQESNIQDLNKTDETQEKWLEYLF